MDNVAQKNMKGSAKSEKKALKQTKKNAGALKSMKKFLKATKARHNLIVKK